MSSLEPVGIVQQRVGSMRRVFFVSVAVLVLVAAVAAIVAEPWFVFRRIGRAVFENDLDALQVLVDPGVPLEQLREALVLAQANPGMQLSPRYEKVSRFVVLARPTAGQRTAGPAELAFVIERHGLSWRLTDLRPDDVFAIGASPPAPAPGPSPAPDDSLPAFGTFVHVDELPEAIERVPPVYPPLARAAGVEGTVSVQVLVDRAGQVRDVRVESSVPMLDSAAVDAVRQWRFKPARSNTRPTAVWVAIPFRFSLR